jgi:hypothetical protein
MVFLLQRDGRRSKSAVEKDENSFLFHGPCHAGKIFSLIIGTPYPSGLIFQRLVFHGTISFAGRLKLTHYSSPVKTDLPAAT